MGLGEGTVRAQDLFGLGHVDGRDGWLDFDDEVWRGRSFVFAVEQDDGGGGDGQDEHEADDERRGVAAGGGSCSRWSAARRRAARGLGAAQASGRLTGEVAGRGWQGFGGREVDGGRSGGGAGRPEEAVAPGGRGVRGEGGGPGALTQQRGGFGQQAEEADSLWRIEQADGGRSGSVDQPGGLRTRACIFTPGDCRREWCLRLQLQRAVFAFEPGGRAGPFVAPAFPAASDGGRWRQEGGFFEGENQVMGQAVIPLSVVEAAGDEPR